MKAAPALPTISPGLAKLFRFYTRHNLRRNFHAVRILKNGFPPTEARPLVIYLNHAAWWDPLVGLLLAETFFPDRSSLAPIDSEMLKRYRFLGRLGFFPVELNTRRGALDFLRTGHAILASSNHALWLTPQGRFVDVRQRPLAFRDGLGILAAPKPNAAFVPLAIEYTFWTEPRPEILVSFGEPVVPALEPKRSSKEWRELFVDALESTQDELADHSCRREPSDWLTLNRGRAGVNNIYDSWRWLAARLRAEKFSPEHHADARR